MRPGLNFSLSSKCIHYGVPVTNKVRPHSWQRLRGWCYYFDLSDTDRKLLPHPLLDLEQDIPAKGVSTLEGNEGNVYPVLLHRRHCDFRLGVLN